ncbi:Amino acid/amide ABC transporter membrane protein 2, HAAT family [Paraburkholderia unamae]|uniref:branched-chain amino acid ABC transporter permease n=1 Tax=Paraburkholderia unamae TaxID=219649 RepID=UPI001CAF21E3|nr:branched-chain amino acid ABC transporter permease [Paraburkholderia unamae]CAG9267687.1 Amino acid/amide ABC transporter membrane protein 2, HAAT family [Paraburkholderia unamae]
MEKRLLPWAILAVLLMAPYVGIYPVFVMKVLCFCLFACAFDLLLGHAGLLSFGHAALFGGAGYVAGYTIKQWGVSPEIGLLLGVLTSSVLGGVMGALAIRRKGIYFAMVTLALAQIIYFVLLQAPFTGGEDGLQAVPRGHLFGLVPLDDDRTLYYVVVAIVVAAFLFVGRIVSSPYGAVLTAIKENEPRSTSLGYDVDRFKLLAFVLSAALAGLAGALKVLVLGFETLTDVHWSMSGSVILMTLIGGMGTRWGPVIGAIVITSLETKLGDVGNALAGLTHIDAFARLGEAVTIVTGLLFIVTVLLLRDGIAGSATALFQRYRERLLLRHNAARRATQGTGSQTGETS